MVPQNRCLSAAAMGCGHSPPNSNLSSSLFQQYNIAGAAFLPPLQIYMAQFAFLAASQISLTQVSKPSIPLSRQRL